MVMERIAFSISAGVVSATIGLTSYTQIDFAMGLTFSFFFSAAGAGAAAFTFAAASSPSSPNKSTSSSSAAGLDAAFTAPPVAAAPAPRAAGKVADPKLAIWE